MRAPLAVLLLLLLVVVVVVVVVLCCCCVLIGATDSPSDTVISVAGVQYDDDDCGADGYDESVTFHQQGLAPIEVGARWWDDGSGSVAQYPITITVTCTPDSTTSAAATTTAVDGLGDLVAGAPTVTCGSFTTGSTNSGTAVVGNAAPERLFRLVLDGVTTVNITTCGSSYDTFLGLYTAVGLANGGNPLITNDDDQDNLCTAGSGLASALTGTLPAANYIIVVEGYGNTACAGTRLPVVGCSGVVHSPPCMTPSLSLIIP